MAATVSTAPSAPTETADRKWRLPPISGLQSPDPCDILTEGYDMRYLGAGTPPQKCREDSNTCHFVFKDVNDGLGDLVMWQRAMPETCHPKSPVRTTKSGSG
ncbi:hypothetical protein JDV02_010605 [Purpureocillium takamizusanense]|uniref:Uncharacterized protein n=1 Tax=Purpureocillium takamizusanense TaxID=2060973 RepID=A0A9Q8QU42_9HYPO|nr:uncharacterized protein JDV02_010605 [Purpureocillium takamizusanense]UNI24886.1 hypothetical protein JDV02_010605 [Purpureocillium takamizusanense]